MASSTIAPRRSSKPTMLTASTNGRRSRLTISSLTIPHTMRIGGRFRSSLEGCTHNSRGVNQARAKSTGRSPLLNDSRQSFASMPTFRFEVYLQKADPEATSVVVGLRMTDDHSQSALGLPSRSDHRLALVHEA